MKKNRNTFFSNYNAQTQSYIPDFQTGMMPNNTIQPMPNNQYGPYNQTSMNSSYYSGPDIQTSNDIDNRLSKIERQINRLDNRLSKLENNPVPEINENSYSNNMYML